VLLTDYLDSYTSQRPGLSVGYCRLLAATARKLFGWAGRPIPLADVDRSMMADWARTLLDRGQSAATVNDKLRMIRTILLAAYDDGLLDRPPRRMRKLPENPPTPEAWTVDEVRRLLEFLERLPGWVGRVPSGQWWSSLTLTIYWTGCRISAMLRTTAADYQPGGLTIRRQKNGRGQWYALPESCCRRIEEVLPESGPIWQWPFHPKTLWNRFRRYVELVGLPCPRTHTQLFYRLRRTNASYCAAVDPAIAQRQLDHSSYDLTRRHYVDPRIARLQSAADVLPDPTSPSDDDPQPPRFRVVG